MFGQVDPIQVSVGSSSLADFNYVYALHIPTRFVDPIGLQQEIIDRRFELDVPALRIATQGISINGVLRVPPTMLPDNAVQGQTFTARGCLNNPQCNIDFTFGKAMRGSYLTDMGVRLGVYVRISANVNQANCGCTCDDTRFIQIARKTVIAGGVVQTLNPTIRPEESRLTHLSGIFDYYQQQNSPGWFVDSSDLSATFNSRTSSASVGDQPATRRDAPAILQPTRDRGAEFYSCVVCKKGNVNFFLACVKWGYYVNANGIVRFEPALPVATCNAPAALAHAAERFKNAYTSQGRKLLDPNLSFEVPR